MKTSSTHWGVFSVAFQRFGGPPRRVVIKCVFSLGPRWWKSPRNKWVFPKIGASQNGWFIMENPIKMDDLGVPLFLETPKWS